MRELPKGYLALVSVNGTGITVSFNTDRAVGINLNGTFINGKFSSGKFYYQNQTVRDLVAAEHNGTVGIYDFITDTFITGTFTSNGYRGTTIQYLSYLFTDVENTIDDASGSLRQSMIADTLEADSFDFTVRYYPLVLDGEDINDVLQPFEEFEYATPISLYQDGELLNVFYLDNIAPMSYLPDGSIRFKFSTLSFVGLLTRQNHNGGMYTAALCKNVVAEIMQSTYVSTTSHILKYSLPNGLYYTIDEAVANTRIDGHLPATNVVLNGESRSARDNLRDVLFVIGASILKNNDGTIRITYNQPSEPTEINIDNIYMGDSYATTERITKVGVVEHSYYQISSTQEQILYDTASDIVDHIKVIFDEPCFSLRGDGVTIHESNCNYAIISGSGILYGKEYTHTQQQLVEDTGLAGADNVRTADNGLINLLNYLNVLKRVKAYFSSAREIDVSFVVKDGIKTGTLVSFIDPLNRQKTGIVSKMDFVISGIIKGNSTIITNWTPTEVGNNYEYCDILTSSGTWNKASKEQQIGRAITECRIVLIGGGSGGTKGNAGSNGSTITGGKGGAGGAGGSAGKVFSVDLEQAPDSFNYSCGAGGNEGQSGGNTTVSGNISYSSANGDIPVHGIINIITQELYALNGSPGISGGDGGDGGTSPQSGQSVGDNTGGNAGSRTLSTTGLWIQFNSASYTSKQAYGYGGGGGGAAYGKNGSNGSSGFVVRKRNDSSHGSSVLTNTVAIAMSGGSGGKGATPITAETPIGYGMGGNGGHGGGGGGGYGRAEGSGYSPYYWPEDSSWAKNYVDSVGSGGSGGNASKGTAGAVLIYY